MIKLIIKDKGFLIKLHKLAPFRTPAIVNISKLDIDQTKTILMKEGISNFIINYESDEKIEPEEQIINYEEDIIEKGTIEGGQNEILGKQIQNIERLLRELLIKNKDPYIIKEIDSHKEEKISIEDDLFDNEEFIPSIDISNLKFKDSNLTTKKETSSNNIERESDLLSSLLEKNNSEKEKKR